MAENAKLQEFSRISSARLTFCHAKRGIDWLNHNKSRHHREHQLLELAQVNADTDDHTPDLGKVTAKHVEIAVRNAAKPLQNGLLHLLVMQPQ
eukprot:COSAG01_NODE_41193_length_454_cov_1.732394_1_plen_92_part_10